MIVVGDVHGWSSRLTQLLDLTPSESTYLFVGDLIDRGPDSAEVVRIVRDLISADQAQCVCGNHEYAAVRAFGCPELHIPSDDDMCWTWLAYYGGEATMHSYGHCQLGEFAEDPQWQDDIHWFAQLPWILEGKPEDLPKDQQLARSARTARKQQAGFLPMPEWMNPILRSNVKRCWPDPRPGSDQADPASQQVHGQLPHCLYRKDVVRTLPHDFPANATLISGHCPQPEPYLTTQRWVVDTSGGLADRPLTAASWPDGKIWQSQ